MASPEVLAKLPLALDAADFIVFDIETTGGNPERNGITEIFAIRWGQGEVKGTFYSMVNPEIPIPPIVRRMTGITNQMVRSAPKIDEVMPKVVEFVGDDVLVSHNTIGDMKFLRHFAREACGVEMGNFYLCTHLLVEKLAPETPDKSLKGLAEHFKLAPGEFHRAEADAYVTLELFKVLLGRLDGRGIKRIAEAVRLQGDLESGMRLGWAVPDAALEGIPAGPGVFSLYDHEGRQIFAASSTALDREVQKIRTFSQLPRQMLRLVLRSYDLKAQRSPSVYAAMLDECDALAKGKITFDPQQWHQRTVLTLYLAEGKDGSVLDVGPVAPGATRVYGPIRDRKQAGDFVAKIGQALGLQPARGNLKIPRELEPLVLSYLDGTLPAEHDAASRRRRSIGLWFKPTERRELTRRLDLMQKLLAIGGRPKMEPLHDKTGVLAVQDADKGPWRAYRIVGGRPVGSVVCPEPGEPRLRQSALGQSLADELQKDVEAVRGRALTADEAARANATLWAIYYARSDCRFVALGELTTNV